MAIDMETATVFVTGFFNKIPTGAMLLVSDQPMIPEGVKTAESDQRGAGSSGKSLRIGIDSLAETDQQRTDRKHLKF